MTSTTSQGKNKSLVAAFIKWSLQRNLSLTVVYTTLLFISFPLIAYWMRATSIVQDESYRDLLNDALYGIAVYLYPFSSLIVSFFAILIAVFMFSFLHNKRSVDMFASLPLKRQTLFLSRYFSGLIMVIIPIIISGLAGLPALIGGDKYNFLFILVGMAYLILTGISVFSLTAFLCICCGKISDCVISSVALSACFPIAIALSKYIFCSYVPGFYNTDAFPTLIYMLLSPESISFAAIFAYDFTEGLSTELVVFTLYWIAFSVACIFGSIAVFNKRKMECAQSGFAFKLPIMIIRFISSYSVGLFLGFIFSESAGAFMYESSSSAHIWFWVGMLAGSFTIHLVLTLIFEKGFRRFGKNLLSYALLLITSIALYLITITGCFGLDVYIPNKEDVASVKVTKMEYFNDSNGFFDESAESISKAIDIHTLITEKSRSDFYPYSATNFFTDDSLYWEFEITYKLKSGRTVTRSYNGRYISGRDIQSKIHEYCTRKEYILGMDPIFSMSAEDISHIEVYARSDFEGNSEEYKVCSPSLEEKERFLETFRSELLSGNNYEYLLENDYNSFSSYGYDLYIETRTFDEYGYADCYDYFIPKTFTKTIALLHEFECIDDLDSYESNVAY